MKYFSQCNVTAANTCNPADLKNTTLYAELEDCILKLEATINSSEVSSNLPFFLYSLQFYDYVISAVLGEGRLWH